MIVWTELLRLCSGGTLAGLLVFAQQPTGGPEACGTSDEQLNTGLH